MDFNPFSPEFRADPYPSYAALRREAPVLPMEAMNAVLVTRYDDVVQVLKSPNLFSSTAIGMQLRNRPTRNVINTDPPVHTQLRGLINRAFTPRMVADLEPRIRDITAALLDRVVGAGETDLVRDLAIPLPVTVIAELLGVEPERHDDFKRWSTSAVTEAGADEEARRQAERDIEEFADYFEQAIEQRRGHPGPDLISAVLAVEESDLHLEPDDLVSFVGLLLIAGNETTTNLIGNAVLALMQHPAELAKVRADATLIPNMVEEALRWDSPVQFLFRTATQDTTIAGTKIGAGSSIIPVYASANRDDARFPDAERFDVTRNTQGHLAFGFGIHFCLGAPLARLEARVALEQVLERLPDLRRVDDAPVARVNSFFLRGLQSLPLRFTPTAVASA